MSGTIENVGRAPGPPGDRPLRPLLLLSGGVALLDLVASASFLAGGDGIPAVLAFLAMVALGAVWLALLGAAVVIHRHRGLWLLLGAPLALPWPLLALPVLLLGGAWAPS